MATAHPTPPDHGEDNFVLELRRVREQIKHKFVELIDCVKARECELLKELDTILASYHSYRDEFQKQKEKKRDLEQTRDFHLNLKTANKTFHENILSEINKELATITFPVEPKMVGFVCDNSIMFSELKLGKLVEKVKSSVDYKSKVHPVVSVCERGNGMEQLYNPHDIAFDNITGMIYVADAVNGCVKAFDSSGKFSFKFGDSDGEGKMNYPRGLVISGYRIFISHVLYSRPIHSILIYQLNGKFVSSIGKNGRSKLEFNSPHGLACNELNGDIYICDSGNNRIQILSKKHKFKSQFGADNLKSPRDVNLSREYIFILDQSNPCLHLHDYNLVLQKSVLTRGEGMVVVSPWYFFIDDSNNILISDSRSKCIKIFNLEFELVHKINTSNKPVGVVVDNQGRVIVVCSSDKDCLQIF